MLPRSAAECFVFGNIVVVPPRDPGRAYRALIWSAVIPLRQKEGPGDVSPRPRLEVRSVYRRCFRTGSVAVPAGQEIDALGDDLDAVAGLAILLVFGVLNAALDRDHHALACRTSRRSGRGR